MLFLMKMSILFSSYIQMLVLNFEKKLCYYLTISHPTHQVIMRIYMLMIICILSLLLTLYRYLMIHLMMLHQILVKLPKIRAQMMQVWMPNNFHMALIPMLILPARKLLLAVAANLRRLPRPPLVARLPRPLRPCLAIRRAPRRGLLW
jgi:hypothetical protein